jgi:hypothetical protein
VDRVLQRNLLQPGGERAAAHMQSTWKRGSWLTIDLAECQYQKDPS